MDKIRLLKAVDELVACCRNLVEWGTILLTASTLFSPSSSRTRVDKIRLLEVVDELVASCRNPVEWGDYPPPSLHALLSIFLTDSCG